MKHERLFIVSVLGFFVNLIGIFVFHHGSAAGIDVVIDASSFTSCEKIFTSKIKFHLRLGNEISAS